MSTALRIHHKQRIQRKRQFYWGADLRGDRQRLGIVSKTPRICSCHQCSRYDHGTKRTLMQKEGDGYAEGYGDYISEGWDD